MQRTIIVCLQVPLGLLMFVATYFLVGVPWVANMFAFDNPEVTHLVVPYSVTAMAAIAAGQVALVFIWRLLKLVASGEIFRHRALRWVNGILICLSVATALAAGVLAFQLLDTTGTVGYFGSVVFLFAATVVGLTVLLLMAVMRGLLVSAIDNRGELDAVI